ncbi:MAG: LppX_LprAFG lipoprotein [Acidimicrobiia bacterium]|nr:LppX_LprAFG lipoprotein [Acidimicrobiia bacterium]
MLRAALALGLVAVACGGSTTAAQLPLDEALAKAGSQFDALTSVRFAITVDGVPVYFDDQGTLAATSADGQYSAPGSFQAVVDVTAFGLSTQLGAISVGADRWITNPVTGVWSLLPFGTGFDPLVLFDPDEGVGATVRRLDATLVDFDDRYHIQGGVGGPTVKVLTAGLVADGELDVDLFIDGDSLHIVELSFDVEGTEGVSEWTIEFSEFDEPVTIEPPE